MSKYVVTECDICHRELGHADNYIKVKERLLDVEWHDGLFSYHKKIIICGRCLQDMQQYIAEKCDPTT